MEVGRQVALGRKGGKEGRREGRRERYEAIGRKEGEGRREGGSEGGTEGRRGYMPLAIAPGIAFGQEAHVEDGGDVEVGGFH